MSDVTLTGFRDVESIVRDTDWNETPRRLIAYSGRSLSSFYRFSLGRPEDYAQEAIKLVLAETRHLPADKPVFHGLCGVVDSLIVHDFEKTQRRGPQIPIGTLPDDQESTGISEERLASGGDDGVATLELHEHLQHFLDLLEPELRVYALARIADEEKTAEEHARALGVSVPDIRNLQKRLVRRREQWNRP